MEFSFSYDEARNILFMDYVSGSLKSREDIDRMVLDLRNKFETVGRKFFVIANVEDFEFNPLLIAYFASKLGIFYDLYVIQALIYNVKSEALRHVVHFLAVQAVLPIGIFNNQNEAIAAIEEYKSNHQ